MASSQKTENLALNRWSATDPVLREDFNADNLIIDAALKHGCKMAYGSFNGCEDMRRSTHGIQLDFVPKIVFLWQTDTEDPWYTAVPMVTGSSTARIACVGSSETGTLDVTFQNDEVSWSPSSGTADTVCNTTCCYLVLG